MNERPTYATHIIVDGPKGRTAHPLIYIDTETGGLDPRKNAILTFAALDGFGCSLYTMVREPNIEYRESGLVEAQALAVNKLDLDTICSRGVGRAEAAGMLATFIEAAKNRLKVYFKFEKIGPAVLVGYNTTFDIGFLRRMTHETPWPLDSMTWYKNLDLFSIAYSLLDLKCQLSDDYSTNHGLPALYLAVTGHDFEGAHDAMNDASATALIFSELMQDSWRG